MGSKTSEEMAIPPTGHGSMQPHIANRSAPWLTIPRVSVVGIEHPFLITNITKAVDSLGKSSKVETLVGKDSTTIEADLHLRPGNRDSKPIASFNSKTNNVLLQITVPKRTGRKRKRGSGGGWEAFAEAPIANVPLLSDPRDARRLARSMRDNPDTYRVEPIGSIRQTHRFRRLPDFVWSTERSPFMAKMKEHILPFEYTKLKNFTFDMSKGIQAEHDIIPPPRWTHQTLPFNYNYHQNPAVQSIYSSTGTTTRNVQVPQRNRISMAAFDTPTVPAQPPEDTVPEESLPEPFRALVGAVREILSHRPVCTRRYLQNHIPVDIWKKVGPNAAKQLWQYVGYIWNSGPWRDSICALGVDPRKDKEMRWYQTMMFQLEGESGESKFDKGKASRDRTKMARELAAADNNREGHIFDGRKVGLDGKVWQLCDITDPMLREMLETDALRDECHEMSDGWYPNGTMAKLRVIMKAKIQMILGGNVDNAVQNQELLTLSQTIPDVMTAENKNLAIFPNRSKRLIGLAEVLRAYVTRPDGSKQGTWGLPAKDQQPRNLRKGGTKGVVSFKPLVKKGGRPSKKEKETNLIGKAGGAAGEKQDVLDPRLKEATEGLEEIERQATMKAFEDISDGSIDESSEDTSATSSGSEDDEEETEGEDDTSEEEAGASEDVAVENAAIDRS
ncbi:MAG: hypothetical protein Q9168_005716 [Polycauliona sp. 1 TL-2023]